jgi:hypothetical protein
MAAGLSEKLNGYEGDTLSVGHFYAKLKLK